MKKLSIGEIKSQLENADIAAKQVALPGLRADSRAGVQKLVAQIERQLAVEEAEVARIASMLEIEHRFQAQHITRIAGVDEAGRGPLAGPVVAAAVVLNPDMDMRHINDSKKIKEQERERLATHIKMHALVWSIAEADVDEIDRLNILQATNLAMSRAISKLGDVQLLLVDGINQPQAVAPVENVISGDARSLSIAAASILAKVHRDQIMMRMDQKYPMYGFRQHKGYGTKMHYEALKKYGPSPIHRRSFDLKC